MSPDSSRNTKRRRQDSSALLPAFLGHLLLFSGARCLQPFGHISRCNFLSVAEKIERLNVERIGETLHDTERCGRSRVEELPKVRVCEAAPIGNVRDRDPALTRDVAKSLRERFLQS